MRIIHGDRQGTTFDVVVVGSGASGLTAALRAAEDGASVAVVEKSAYLGGTSAISGGMLWMPGNGLPTAPDPETDRAAARRYIERVTLGRARADLLDAHLARVPVFLDFVRRTAGLEFDVIGRFPDYESAFDGAADGGRSVEPRMWSARRMGAMEQHLRPDPRPPFRQDEYFEEWRTYSNIPWDELAERAAAGITARGRALVAPLIHASAERGVTFAVDGRVERLVVEDGRVVGVTTEQGARLDARRGVILASGGFEWSDELCTQLLSGPVRARCGIPSNEGDGLRMAMAVGTGIANTNEAWWGVMAHMPGLETDDAPVQTIITVERSLPGSICVNRFGERFFNEAGSYYNAGKLMATFEAHSYDYRNLPAYLVADARFFTKHGILGQNDPSAVPAWITSADDLPGLAAKLGIDAPGLVATVERFNEHARNGVDPDFHRGEKTYDRYFGDAEADHPNLAPLEQGPFFAVEITCGAIGTKGGVTTDVDGRALDPFGDVIAGLFAVGNVSAHPIAYGYAGAGSTLGPGMTMGMAAGAAAASSGA